jgi:3-dehydroquinate dehydratase/shikimate dehydrogenase
VQVLVTISQFRHDLRMTSTTPAIAAHQLRSRMGRICVSVNGATANELLARAEQISDNNPFIELRLDTLNKPQAILPKLRSFTSTNRHVTVIATCRRTGNVCVRAAPPSS